jgi:hypothetical protein
MTQKPIPELHFVSKITQHGFCMQIAPNLLNLIEFDTFGTDPTKNIFRLSGFLSCRKKT